VATRVVDTHTHFYDPTRKEGVPWPSKGSPLYRPVYPADWGRLAAPHGIRETVVVEASAWVEDNDWILKLAEREKSIVGFVGHLLPQRPEFPQQLRRYAQNTLFRGIRVSGRDLLDSITTEPFLKGVRLLAEMGLSLDVNGLGAEGIPAVTRLAQQLPDLRMILDHCGGCGDAQKLKPSWKPQMAAAAAQKNVFCKVSALVEMTDAPAGQAPQETEYYLPVLDALWEQFGPERVVFGSNWPVSDKGASFDVLFHIVSEYFSAKGQAACEAYFWQNSRSFYRWVERA
jgi:L-fuconolactonase